MGSRRDACGGRLRCCVGSGGFRRLRLCGWRLGRGFGWSVGRGTGGRELWLVLEVEIGGYEEGKGTSAVKIGGLGVLVSVFVSVPKVADL